MFTVRIEPLFLEALGFQRTRFQFLSAVYVGVWYYFNQNVMSISILYGIDLLRAFYQV
jgi:hypothetical protein